MKRMNVVFITQDDPFYVRLFFEEFFHRYPDRDGIRGVVIAPPMGKKGFAALIRQMYDFYGPLDFLRVGFKYVGYKLAAKLPSALRGSRFFSIEQVCRHHGVAVTHASRLNESSFLEWLRGQEPDLVISVAAPQIFREELIGIPRLGCINIHNARLPKYRGMLPNFWQMFNGEKSVGTTIHRINAKIDEGDILLQEDTPIESGETLDALIRRTKRSGARLMIRMLEQFRDGEVHALPNRSEEATYFTFPTRDQVRVFRQRGYRLL